MHSPIKFFGSDKYTDKQNVHIFLSARRKSAYVFRHCTTKSDVCIVIYFRDSHVPDTFQRIIVVDDFAAFCLLSVLIKMHEMICVFTYNMLFIIILLDAFHVQLITVCHNWLLCSAGKLNGKLDQFDVYLTNYVLVSPKITDCFPWPFLFEVSVASFLFCLTK